MRIISWLRRSLGIRTNLEILMFGITREKKTLIIYRF